MIISAPRFLDVGVKKDQIKAGESPGNEHGTGPSLAFVLCCPIVALSCFSFCRLVFASFLLIVCHYLICLFLSRCLALCSFIVEILNCCPLAHCAVFLFFLLSFCPLLHGQLSSFQIDCPVVFLCTRSIVLASACPNFPSCPGFLLSICPLVFCARVSLGTLECNLMANQHGSHQKWYCPRNMCIPSSMARAPFHTFPLNLFFPHHWHAGSAIVGALCLSPIFVGAQHITPPQKNVPRKQPCQKTMIHQKRSRAVAHKQIFSQSSPPDADLCTICSQGGKEQ